jgi:hypothetical protein
MHIRLIYYIGIGYVYHSRIYTMNNYRIEITTNEK